jgi:Uma2 family endonuclease
VVDTADMTLPTRDSKYHTYGDYLIWSREHGDELIDGVAYVKEPPPPTPTHQVIAGELYRQIANVLERPARVYIAPFDVRLPKENERDDLVNTVVQPDVCIVCDPTKVDMRGCRGGPDWLVEVLSPSTARYDRFKKIPVYERAGVREVWLIQPKDRTVSIFLLQDGRYGEPTVSKLKGRTALTAVPGIVIRWKPLVDDLTYG